LINKICQLLAGLSRAIRYPPQMKLTTMGKKHDMPLILHYKAHKKYSKYDVLKMLCMQGHKKI